MQLFASNVNQNKQAHCLEAFWHLVKAPIADQNTHTRRPVYIHHAVHLKCRRALKCDLLDVGLTPAKQIFEWNKWLRQLKDMCFESCLNYDKLDFSSNKILGRRAWAMWLGWKITFGNVSAIEWVFPAPQVILTKWILNDRRTDAIKPAMLLLTFSYKQTLLPCVLRVYPATWCQTADQPQSKNVATQYTTLKQTLKPLRSWTCARRENLITLFQCISGL